jgi:cytochrome c oxidase cbb3-type subunit 3
MTRTGLLLTAIVALATAACDRERREFDLPEALAAEPESPGTASPFEGNAWAASEGKRLYQWMNCAGCHAMGGGGMGPPLLDAEWVYGSAPQDVFTSIVEGRPNGMPSFKAKLAEEQVWKLVEYVRSMSALTPKNQRPGRSDSLYPGPAENRRSPQPVVEERR